MKKVGHRTALITGATSDIGLAIARKLARSQYDLLLNGRQKDRLRAIAEEIGKLGVKSAILPADIATANRAERLARSARIQLERWKSPLHAIIHVAGKWHDNRRAFVGRDFMDTEISEVEEVLDVSMLATIRLTKHLLDLLPRRAGASIVAITGTFPHGGAGWLHYFVAKQGLELFLGGLSTELKKHRIRVNCVSPSYVSTEPLKHFMPGEAASALMPEDVADMVEFIMSPRAQNITGQIIEIEKQK